MRVRYDGPADVLRLPVEDKTLHQGDEVTLSQDRMFQLIDRGHRFTEIEDGEPTEPVVIDPETEKVVPVSEATPVDPVTGEVETATEVKTRRSRR